MSRRILVVMMSVLLAALGGCGNGGGTTDCIDNDGDTFGVGADCAGLDCNDADPNCNAGACCNTGNCIDNDGDGYGANCPNGPDCDDNNDACWAAGSACCPANCIDLDGDGFGANCANGPDCDDNDAGCSSGACCTGGDCLDLDGDQYGIGADCLGTDCDDSNNQCWTEGDACCPLDCLDLDGDTYGNGPDCTGPDCDDNNNQCWQAGDACCPVFCTDNDGDGYGMGVDCLGPDCDDNNDQCWQAGDACCPTDLDLTGTWAQRFCQNEEYEVAIGDPVQGTRISIARIELTHTGNQVLETSSVCAVLVPPMGLVEVTFPDALVSSIPSINTTRTLEPNAVGAVYENSDAPIVQLIAWNPDSDPINEAIPTDAGDPRVYDQDGDGNVGGTAEVAVGALEGQIYVVARTVMVVTGTVVSPVEISGTVEATSEQSTLGASSALFEQGADITQMAGSTFQKAKLTDPNMTCAQIVAQMDTVFGGPCPAFP